MIGVENRGYFSVMLFMAVTNVKPSVESGKLTLKNQKWEWKIIHHWVSFPTQIDKFWDTGELSQSTTDKEGM